MKLLVVGDPHVTVEELEDCQALLDLVVETAEKHRVDRVVILGDLHHNHAVVRVEVMDFWRRNLQRLKALTGVPPVCIVGNHDRSHDSSQPAHALEAYRDLAEVVDEPHPIGSGILVLPYYHRHEDFLQAIAGQPQDRVLFCHQSFNGARFDNGFYDPQGIDPDRFPNPVISGHIHTPQSVGDRIWYPGAPRWRTASDVNVTRSIWVLEFDGPKMLTRTPVHTDVSCRKLIDLTFREGEEMTVPEIHGPSAVSISLHGSQEWVDSLRDIWTRSGALVRTFPTKVNAPKVRESEGISVALQKHVSGYQPKYGTPTEVLQKLVAERVAL